MGLSASEIATKAATIKAYLREAVAAAKAGMKVETKPREIPLPDELKETFREDPKFKRAFEALTPGRQRRYLFHFTGAKQSATRTARIEKAMRSSKVEGSWRGDRSWFAGEF